MLLIATDEMFSAIEGGAEPSSGSPRLVGTKRPADSAAAVELLLDLRSGSERTVRGIAFARRITALREAHPKTPSLLARLRRPVIVATARFLLSDNLLLGFELSRLKSTP
jgi:hypothetical protein